MKTERGPGVERDFPERVVFFEHIDSSELIEIEAGMRSKHRLQNLGAEINVFGPNERADTAALVALFDLVPPAVDLIAHHRRLIHKKNALGQEL